MEELLQKLKLSLRLDSDDLDEDIISTVNACKLDLKISGIDEDDILNSDPLIYQAIKAYCKFDMSTDSQEAARYKKLYESLREHFALSEYYIEWSEKDLKDLKEIKEKLEEQDKKLDLILEKLDFVLTNEETKDAN